MLLHVSLSPGLIDGIRASLDGFSMMAEADTPEEALLALQATIMAYERANQ